MIVQIKVIAGVAASEVVGKMADGTLKVKVHAVREGGRANEELVRVLAEHFGVARSNISIIRGATASRRKTVEIQ